MSETMSLTFLSDNPLNSTVIDLDNGGHLYDITTELDFESPKRRSRTTIYGPDGVVVAVWERTYRQDEDRVTFRDEVHALGGWLPKKSVLSRTRMLIAPGGERYHWKQTTQWGTQTLKLVHPQTQETIARVRTARNGTGLLSSQRRMGLIVHPGAKPILDVIVLSFVILEQIRRELGATLDGDRIRRAAAARGFGGGGGAISF